jgi:mannose-6-phosphate isomerase-like protein (cupin superfamily)
MKDHLQMNNTRRVLDAKHMLVQSIEQFETSEFSDKQHSIRITSTTGEITNLDSDSSHYVVIYSGEFKVSLANRTYNLSEGCFGSFPGTTRLQGGGYAFILSSVGYYCPILVGGPLEERGRLRYVDGCTASLLLPPPVRGEPCLNFMHLPRQVSQTMHTHTSLRMGIILSGSGQCRTHEGLFEFHPGNIFFIPPNLPHSFQSMDESLRIVIFHPDSDSGPTHTDHTMLNRTFVDGQSAQLLTHLHSNVETQQ